MTTPSGRQVWHVLDRKDGLDRTWTYEYDEENRLIEIKRKADEATVAKYEYDALGRRVHSIEYVDAATGLALSPPRKTRHVYVGLETIQEYNVVGTPYDETTTTPATLLREFVWGDPGRFPEPVAMVRHCDIQPDPPLPEIEEVFHYLHDALGSVIGLTDSTGALVERYLYDPYGKPFVETSDGQGGWTAGGGASTVGNPFMWTGQRYDSATGLYAFLFRTYSPALGRWLQRDPLDYVDGVNLYEYVMGDPLGWTDPFGLDGEEPPSGEGNKGCEGNGDDRGKNPFDPTDGSPIKPDPKDPCHTQCTANRNQCIKEGHDQPTCKSDGNKCIRVCNKAKERSGYTKGDDPDGHNWKRDGAGVAQSFWDGKGKDGENCRTRSNGHPVVASNEPPNERAIRKAKDNLRAWTFGEKATRTARRWSAQGALVGWESVFSHNPVLHVVAHFGLEALLDKILEADGDNDDPEVAPYEFGDLVGSLGE